MWQKAISAVSGGGNVSLTPYYGVISENSSGFNGSMGDSTSTKKAVCVALAGYPFSRAELLVFWQDGFGRDVRTTGMNYSTDPVSATFNNNLVSLTGVYGGNGTTWAYTVFYAD